MATKANAPLGKSTPLSIEGEPDPIFLDDLIAANHFKTFLVGRGIDLPTEVTDGLSLLIATFQNDIGWYRATEEKQAPRDRVWPWQRRHDA